MPSALRARDIVRDKLRDLILAGRLPAASRLEEIELSGRLGVSRTPFREALIALQEEGLVQSQPNKGFVVTPLSEALVREVYPVLAILEGGAIRLAGKGLADSVEALAALNQALAAETEPARQYDLDAAFHRTLWAGCGNARLVALLEQHWRQASRFNGAGERGTADRDGSCAEHAEIIEALRQRRPDRAATLMEAHWLRGQDVVIGWLRRRG